MTVALSQEYPLYDGVAPSWSDVKTVLNITGGGTVDDIDYAAFKFGTVVTFGEQIGASGGRVIRRTTGSKKDTLTATYYKSGLRKLLRALIPHAQVRGNQRLVGLVHFDVVTLHSPPGDPDGIYEQIARGCRLTKIDGGWQEGDDADKVELDLSPLEVAFKIDGVEVVLL